MKLAAVALAIIAALLVSSVALRNGVSKKERDDEVLIEHVPVETVSVKLEDGYSVKRRYSGELAPLRTSDLGFERSGYVESILTREGSKVEKDGMIATMDTRRLEEQLRDLAAKEREAKAVLDELIAGPRAQELRAAIEDVKGLTAQLDYAKLTRSRNEKLLQRNAGTIDDLQSARAREQQVAAELASAKERLDELNEGSRREKIQAQAARSDQLASQTNLLKIELEDSTLRAPYAGRIAERFIHEGTVIEKGEPVVRLLEVGKLTARIGVPFDTVAMLPKGKAINVYAAGRPYKGIIATRLPALSEITRTATVIVDLDDTAAAELIVGGVVHLEIQQNVDKPGCWLPTSALVRGTRGLWACLAVSEIKSQPGSSTKIGLLQKHDIEILHTGESEVFVRGTFRAGDQVVADGTHRVVQGQWVELGQWAELPNTPVD